uniref:CC2D2AN-C2 domain-containing protein n=1 Tax=Macrostomum lignano TaxID=282301 RepID=A0A1I8HXJ4_9PLAT
MSEPAAPDSAGASAEDLHESERLRSAVKTKHDTKKKRLRKRLQETLPATEGDADMQSTKPPKQKSKMTAKAMRRQKLEEEQRQAEERRRLEAEEAAVSAAATVGGGGLSREDRLTRFDTATVQELRQSKADRTVKLAKLSWDALREKKELTEEEQVGFFANAVWEEDEDSAAAAAAADSGGTDRVDGDTGAAEDGDILVFETEKVYLHRAIVQEEADESQLYFYPSTDARLYVGRRPRVGEGNILRLQNILTIKADLYEEKKEELEDPTQQPPELQREYRSARRWDSPFANLERETPWQLEVDIGSVQFLAHPLFTLEHSAVSRLRQLYAVYAKFEKLNFPAYFRDRVAAIRRELGKLDQEVARQERSQQRNQRVLADCRARIDVFRSELETTRQSRLRAEAEHYSRLIELIEAWREVRTIRQEAGFSVTDNSASVERYIRRGKKRDSIMAGMSDQLTVALAGTMPAPSSTLSEAPARAVTTTDPCALSDAPTRAVATTDPCGSASMSTVKKSLVVEESTTTLVAAPTKRMKILANGETNIRCDIEETVQSKSQDEQDRRAEVAEWLEERRAAAQTRYERQMEAYAVERRDFETRREEYERVRLRMEQSGLETADFEEQPPVEPQMESLEEFGQQLDRLVRLGEDEHGQVTCLRRQPGEPLVRFRLLENSNVPTPLDQIPAPHRQAEELRRNKMESLFTYCLRIYADDKLVGPTDFVTLSSNFMLHFNRVSLVEVVQPPTKIRLDLVQCQRGRISTQTKVIGHVTLPKPDSQTTRVQATNWPDCGWRCDSDGNILAPALKVYDPQLEMYIENPDASRDKPVRLTELKDPNDPWYVRLNYHGYLAKVDLAGYCRFNFFEEEFDFCGREDLEADSRFKAIVMRDRAQLTTEVTKGAPMPPYASMINRKWV